MINLSFSVIHHNVHVYLGLLGPRTVKIIMMYKAKNPTPTYETENIIKLELIELPPMYPTPLLPLQPLYMCV